MKGNALETIAGALVLGLAAIILAYAYLGQQTSDFKGYPLIVRFEKADGLVEGSDVKVSGIKIGYVETLSMDDITYQAVAKIMVRETVKLPTDTSAAIISESLLGGKYLSLTPGGDEENLEPGAEIGYAQSSVILENLIGQLVFNNKKEDEKNAA